MWSNEMPISFIHQNNTQASDFRYVYSNTVSVQFMGSEGILTFPVVRNPANPNDGAEEQIAVGMTVAGLKALAYTLSRVTQNYEKATGSEIPLSSDLIKATDDAIASTITKKET